MKRLILFLSFLFLFRQELLATVAADDCKHNLSWGESRPGVDIYATEASGETQVCKFCHIPHGALTTDTTQYARYDDIYPTGQTSWTDGPQTWRLPLISHKLTTNKNTARVSTSSGIWSAGYPMQVRMSTWAYGPDYPTDPEDEDFRSVRDGHIYFDRGPDDAFDSGDESMEMRWMPSGVSRVCFSCHDGSIPIGALVTGTTIQMGPNATKLHSDGRLRRVRTGGSPYYEGSSAGFPYHNTDDAGDSGNIRGTLDFGSRHPNEHGFYSFYMTEEVQGDPRTTRGLLHVSQMKEALDRYNFVQCTACHDPHKGGQGTPSNGREYPDTVYGAYTGGLRQFWRKPGEDSKQVCIDCHTPQ